MHINGTGRPLVAHKLQRPSVATHPKLSGEADIEDTFSASSRGNTDATWAKATAGAVLGAFASFLPVAFLASNGIGGNLAPALTMVGGMTAGAVFLANADVEIGFGPSPS